MEVVAAAEGSQLSSEAVQLSLSVGASSVVAVMMLLCASRHVVMVIRSVVVVRSFMMWRVCVWFVLKKL